jgi:hypothetical protein
MRHFADVKSRSRLDLLDSVEIAPFSAHGHNLTFTQALTLSSHGLKRSYAKLSFVITKHPTNFISLITRVQRASFFAPFQNTYLKLVSPAEYPLWTAKNDSKSLSSEAE